jgi:hypothetical protein
MHAGSRQTETLRQMQAQAGSSSHGIALLAACKPAGGSSSTAAFHCSTFSPCTGDRFTFAFSRPETTTSDVQLLAACRLWLCSKLSLPNCIFVLHLVVLISRRRRWWSRAVCLCGRSCTASGCFASLGGRLNSQQLPFKRGRSTDRAE